jgi:hypothetical protein
VSEPNNNVHPHVLTATELLRSPIIILLLNVIVAGVMTFINWAFITGRYTERFSNIEKTIGGLEANYKTINNEGTAASKLQLRLDAAAFENIKARLSLIEPKVEQIPVMQIEIRRIAEQQREQHPLRP